MKVNQIKIGVILSYISQFVQIAIAFIYTPVMLRLLGKSEYGLYQMVFSVISYLSVFSFGFSSSYVRFYSRFGAEGDEKGIKKLNGMYVIIFTVISFIIAILGIVMLYNVELIFGEGFTNDEIKKIKILLLLMIIDLIITFETTTFDCNIIAEEHFIFQKIVIIAQQILGPLVTLPILVAGKGAVGMVVVTTCVTFLKGISSIIFAIKHNGMRFQLRGFDWLLLKEMWIFTFFIFLNNVIDQVNWSVDKYLIGRIKGVEEVAIYGVASQFNTMYLQFSTSVSNVFVPRINKMVSAGKSDKELSDLFIRVGRIQCLILMMIITGYILYGKLFVSYWAGEEYVDSFLVGVFLMVPVSIPLIQNLGIEIQRAKNKHKFRSIIYSIIAVVNIGISIPLIYQMGATGAALGTGISLVVGNIIIMNWYYYSKLNIDIKAFWREIASILPSVCIAFAIGFVVNLVFSEANNWYFLVIKIVAYVLVYFASVYLLGMNTYEKSIVKKFLRVKQKEEL